MKTMYFAAAVVAACGVPAYAQTAATLVVGAPQVPLLRAGTPVMLRTMTELTTKGKHLKVGDRFSMEVAEAVSINDQVVIPVGSNAVGEVTGVRNKGMWGKSGNIETRLLYVTANSRKIRLSGSVGDKGKKAGGGAIATSAIVFLPAGFFMTGTSAVVPRSTTVTGLLDEDVPVVFATAPSVAPMTIPATPVTVVSMPAKAAGAPAVPASGSVAPATSPIVPVSATTER